MDNLGEMDRFWEEFHLPRLNQEEIEIMNNPITSMKLKLWSKTSQKNKSPGPEGFTGEFYQTSREELIPTLLKLFQKNCRGRNTSKLILWGHHHPDTKIRQRQHRKENYRPISLMNIYAKILNKILANNSATHQKAYTPWSSLVFSRNARILQYMQIDQCDTPY